MSSIKVGDRIRDYGSTPTGRVGTVTEVVGCCVRYLSGSLLHSQPYSAHIKCVRKLVKKKRREIWIGEYNDGKTRMAWFPTKEQVPVQLIDGSVLVRAIRFVESKEGK